LPDLSLTNPDASIAGMGLHPATWCWPTIHLSDHASVLDLSSSADGLNWHLEHTLERGAPPDEIFLSVDGLGRRGGAHFLWGISKKKRAVNFFFFKKNPGEKKKKKTEN